jgi:hypothetical protein
MLEPVLSVFEQKRLNRKKENEIVSPLSNVNQILSSKDS